MLKILYLNTDLDLVAPFNLEPLAAEFASRDVRALHIRHAEDGLWYATFETWNVDFDTPELAISKLLDAIESLDAEFSVLWSQCNLREFNIGYDCGDEPWAFNNGLTNQTLNRIAVTGASLRITLYPPDRSAACKPPRNSVI